MARKRTGLLEALETESVSQLDEVRSFRTARGKRTFDEYQKRAKVALGIIGGYIRLRATLANEETNRLVAMRVEGSGPRLLPAVPKPTKRLRAVG